MEIKTENSKMSYKSIVNVKIQPTRNTLVSNQPNLPQSKIKYSVDTEPIVEGNIEHNLNINDRLLPGWKAEVHWFTNLVGKQTLKSNWSMKHKERNKLVKIINGNIVKKTLRIFHWNLGSRFWKWKQDKIQSIVDVVNSDIMYISEANIFKADPEHELNIVGYNLELPLTWKNPRLEYARIALLIKQDLNYELLPQHMETDISTMWLKLNRIRMCGHRRCQSGFQPLGISSWQECEYD